MKSLHWNSLYLMVTLALLGGAPAESVNAETPSSAVPAPRSDQWWKERHQQYLEHASKTSPPLVFLGNSITEGWGKTGSEVWEKFYAPRNALNLGISGDRTQHVLWRIQNGELEELNPKLLVLMIGTNNLPDGRSTPEETIVGIKAVVQEIHRRLPETHLLLLGIFPRAELPSDPLRERVDSVNEGIQPLGEEPWITYADIGDVFLEADGRLDKQIMPDFLHLSAEGYSRWAEAIEKHVAAALEDSTDSN